METRASYLIVGVFVLALAAAGALFSIWLTKTDIDKSFDHYDIIFEGSVSGLQSGSQVYFRGVPVGRVTDIMINDEDITEIIARVEIEAGTPVRTDSRAGLVPQGITGLANIEFKGGSNESPMLKSEDDRPPRIIAQTSPIEAVFDSAPELLSSGVLLLQQMTVLLSEDNIARVNDILAELHSVLGALAKNTDSLDTVLSGAADTATNVDQMITEVRTLTTNLVSITDGLDTQIDTLIDSGSTTLEEVNRSAGAVRNLAWRADRMLSNVDKPLTDLSNSGLYEFGELITEMRALTATLTRITKDFERDPAGFLLGGSQRGFTP